MPPNQPAGGEPSRPSLTDALRGWLHDGTELLRVRLDLLGLEAREHALSVVELLLWGLASVILLGLGVGFLAVLVTVVLWDSHRTLALSLFAGAFLSGGVLALLLARQRWSWSRRWFEASTTELSRDAERLKP